MSEPVLTPAQEAMIATAIKQRKPYLLKIEEAVAKNDNGFVEVKLEVRQGRVEKMTFYKGEYWIREHEATT